MSISPFPAMKNTKLSRLPKSSPLAITIAILAIALVVTIGGGMSKLRDRDKLAAETAAELAVSRAETVELQAQLNQALNDVRQLQKQVSDASSQMSSLESRTVSAEQEPAGMQKATPKRD